MATAAHGEFRGRYGESPLHLLAVLATFAIAGYALLEIGERPAPLSFAIWFLGAIVAHDLIAFPFYSLLARIAGRASVAAGEPGRRALNYVRVPAILSVLALVVWSPFILGLSSETYEAASGRSTEPYFGRWLGLTGALFALSAVLYAISIRRSRARG